MDWITTANGLIVLITGAFGLIAAAVSLFALIKNLIKTSKKNTIQENWKLVMKIADEAMQAASYSTLNGAGKKESVIAAVKAGCNSVGVNADLFLNQLSDYIDDCIKFKNGFKKD